MREGIMHTKALLSMGCACLLAWAAVGSAEDAKSPPKTGELLGTVRFTGKVPEPKKVATTSGTQLEYPVEVDPNTQGVLNAVVMLEDAPPQPKLKTDKPVIVDQKDERFVPRVVAVQYGRVVRFDNSDNINHSVEASSLVEANQFNRIAGPGFPVEQVFEPQKPPVMIGCSLHPWMRAWVYVVQHPWFAVTDKNGRFTIANVPPGSYQLLVAHADSNLRERRAVEVKAGQTLKIDVNWNKLP
jgi:plastocyanin